MMHGGMGSSRLIFPLDEDLVDSRSLLFFFQMGYLAGGSEDSGKETGNRVVLIMPDGMLLGETKDDKFL